MMLVPITTILKVGSVRDEGDGFSIVVEVLSNPVLRIILVETLVQEMLWRKMPENLADPHSELTFLVAPIAFPFY